MELNEFSAFEESGTSIATDNGDADINCVYYYPGMLAEIEDELNADRDTLFEQEFFYGC